MSNFGTFSLYIALGLSLWGLVIAFVAYRSGDQRYLKSAIRTVYAVCAVVLVATGTLLWALVTDNFAIKYVWEYSRTTQPLVYKFTALWGGMSGSLLWWLTLLCIFSALTVTFNRRNNLRILPFTTFLLFLTMAFFLVILNFKISPFAPLVDSSGILVSTYPAAAFKTIQGNGLNPLLQNFYMAIHPPLLYTGYVGCAIPFALVMGALAHKQGNAFWMRSARNWALFFWLCLGIGILLGGYWAYIELGWGGYWAWDPVENASFLPWLTGTAFLHSFFMQAKRGIYRFWTAIFISATFLLSIFGTFLTRSGILQSVHAFAQEDPSVPWYFRLSTIFVAFMVLILVLSVVLIVRRRKLMVSGQPLESAGSRESMILYAMLALGLFTVVVFAGEVLPLFYRWLKHHELHVGPSWYNPRIIPIALLVLLLMGIGSIAPWRKGGWNSYKKHLGLPLASGLSALIVSVAVFFISGKAADVDFSHRPKDYIYLFLCVGLIAFVATIIISEYVRTARGAMKKPGMNFWKGLFDPFRTNPRRYGGYTIHFGILFIFLGITFSSAFQVQYQQNMKVGQAARFGPYTVRLASLDYDKRSLKTANDQRIWANLQVFSHGRFISLLRPMRVFYAANPEQPTYEVAIRSTPLRDFYTVMAGYDLNKGEAIIGAYITPMVFWIWVGGVFILLGGLIALGPLRRL